MRFRRVIRTYFTLEDIKEDLGILPNQSGPFAMQGATGSFKTTMLDFLNACLSARNLTNIVDTELNGSDYAYKMWTDYLYPQFYNKHVSFTNEPELSETGYEVVGTFVGSIGTIYSWLKSSNERYSLLIKNLDDNKQKLLDKISSTSKVKFNDTPQTESASYSNDNFNTNITTTESSTDGTTVMTRLKEIENDLSMLYKMWADEFRKFIFWSVI